MLRNHADEFLRAKERRERREKGNGGHGAGIAIGIAIGLGAAGLLIALFSRRRGPTTVNQYITAPTPATQATLPPPAPSSQAIAPLPAVPGVSGAMGSAATDMVVLSPPRGPRALVVPGSERRDAVLRTGALPPMSAPGSRLLFTAGKRSAQAVIRVIGPAGSFAAVAFDPSQLLSGSFSITNPSADVFMIPSSTDAPIVRVKPGQSLYAKGSVSGVVISISASDIDDV